MTARRARSEHTEQAVLVGLVRNFYPDVLIFAVPNGGLRDPRVAVKLKAEGVLPGVPDLVVAEPRGTFHGCYLEIKAQGGRASKDQLRIMIDLEERGYHVILEEGSTRAFAALEAYLSLPEPKEGE